MRYYPWRSVEWLTRLRDDRSSVEAEFLDGVGYPLPWCESVAAAELESIAWMLCGRARVNPPTINIRVALESVWEHMPKQALRDRWDHDGLTERIGEVVLMHRIPTDCDVLLIPDSTMLREDVGGPMALRTRMKTVVDSMFWGEGTWVIDAKCHWVLVARHEWKPEYWEFD